MNEENTVSSSQDTTDPGDDSSVVVVLDQEQYQVLVDHLVKYDSDMQDLKDDILSVKSSVDLLNASNSSSSESVAVPDDFYSYLSDVEGQQVFFLSLLVGLVIGFIFFFGLHR